MLNEAQAAVAEKLEEKAGGHYAVMADSINPKSDEKVEVVLFSSGKLDATDDPKTRPRWAAPPLATRSR